MDINYDKIVEDTERLKKEILEDRLSRGLPPEPPEDFVNPAMSAILIERCEPLFTVIAKYAKLVNDAGEFIPIDLTKFDKYLLDLHLIRMTKGKGVNLSSFSFGIRNAIGHIKKSLENEDKDPGDLTKHLFLALKIAQFGRNKGVSDAYDVLLDIRYDEQIKPHQEEYDRLKSDVEFFESEYDRYKKHYESIKHLI